MLYRNSSLIPLTPQYESAFLNYFTYLAHNDSTKRMRPPFVNSFKSLVKDPSASTYGESTIEPDQKASKFPKINILTTSRINRIYFAIKVQSVLKKPRPLKLNHSSISV